MSPPGNVVICDHCLSKFEDDYIEHITPPLLGEYCYVCGNNTKDNQVSQRDLDKALENFQR